MTTSIHTMDIIEVRIQRRVYEQWSTLIIRARNKEGKDLAITLEGADYQLNHKPIPVTWQKPDTDVLSATDIERMQTSIEAFNITHLNQPEDPRIEEIKGIIHQVQIPVTIGHLTEHEAVVAIREVLFGEKADPVGDPVRPIPIPPGIQDALSDDEIPF